MGFPPSSWIFVLFMLVLTWYAICPRPPHTGNLPDACVRNRSIGLSPPRLPYGRAANYGSIINPRACLRLRRWQSGFACNDFIARFRGHGAPAGPALEFPLSSGNVSGKCLFGFQGSTEGLFRSLEKVPSSGSRRKGPKNKIRRKICAHF